MKELLEGDICKIFENDLKEKYDEKYDEFIEKYALTGDGYIEKRMCENCKKEFEKGGIKVPEIILGEGWKYKYFCCEKCIKEYKNID